MKFDYFNLIPKLHKIPWWVLSAFASLSLIDSFIGPLIFMENPVAQGGGKVAILLLIFKAINSGYKNFRIWKKNIVAPLKTLNEQQEHFLLEIYGNGSRKFEVGGDVCSCRWFEELQELNYIEDNKSKVDLTILYPESNFNHKVTPSGWKKLKKLAEKKP